MIAHVAGVPVEELLPLAVVSGAGVVAATRAWIRRDAEATADALTFARHHEMVRRRKDNPKPRADLVGPDQPPPAPAPDDRAWSARRNVPERAARTDLVPYMALPAETGPIWAPDQLSIWPVEGGRFGIDAHYHGASGRAAPPSRRGGLSRVHLCGGRARGRERRDAPARPARPPGGVAGDRGLPRPPGARDRRRLSTRLQPTASDTRSKPSRSSSAARPARISFTTPGPW